MAEGNNIVETVTKKMRTIDKITIEGYTEVDETCTKHKPPECQVNPSPVPRQEGESTEIGSEMEMTGPASEHGSFTEELEGELNPICRITDKKPIDSPKLPYDRFKPIEDPSKLYALSSYSKGVRGYGIIIVNSFSDRPEHCRKGADEDVKLISQLFRNLGIEAIICQDKSRIYILDLVENLRKESKHFDKYGSLFVAISTHGAEGDIIFGNDLKEIPLDGIVSKFDNVNCPSLIGKPRVFLVQACRGPLTDHQVGREGRSGTSRMEDSNRTKHDILSATKQDCLIAYASNPGYKARRDEYGSWFFQALYHAYPQYGNIHPDFEQILKLTNRLMIENFTIEKDDILQPSHISSNLTKLLLMPYMPKCPTS